MSVSTTSQITNPYSVTVQSYEVAPETHQQESAVSRVGLGVLSVAFLLCSALFYLYTIDFLFAKLSHGSYQQFFQFFQAI